MKKYIGLIILVISISISGVLIKSRSVAVPEEKIIEVPYVKTMMIIPQTVKASISSQGIVQPQSELNIISEFCPKVILKLLASPTFKVKSFVPGATGVS